MLLPGSFLSVYFFITLCCLTESSKRCSYEMKADRSVQLASTTGSFAGALLLKSRHVENILTCKVDCCEYDRCNVIVFHHERDLRHPTNCYLIYCDGSLGCQLEISKNYFTFAMDDAYVRAPEVAASSYPNTTLLPSYTTSTVAGYTSTIPGSETSVMNLGSTASNVVKQTSTASETVANEIGSTHTESSTMSRTEDTTDSDIYTASGTTVTSLMAGKTYKDSPPTLFRHSIAMLVSFVAFGILIMIATSYIIWNTSRGIRYRKYKEIVFLLNDDSTLYA